jgi:hypothetical protein
MARTCNGISNARRNRRIRITVLKRGFDGRDQVEQIANLFYKTGMILCGSTVFSRMEYLQERPEKTGIHPAGLPEEFIVYKEPAGRRSWQVVS